LSHPTVGDLYARPVGVSSLSSAPPELIGRERETARLDAVLDRLRDRGDALLICGEAGIGKSALLDHARKRASGLGARVLETVGVESEAELAFAGLHRLLRPISKRIDSLPAPQRQALNAAFGVADEVQPDPFRVALAVFQLVSGAADASPLILIVDDAQWVDRSSLGVLSFVARRLENEPVALMAAVRDGFATPLEEARLPTVEVARLDEAEAGELLDRTAPDLPAGARGGGRESAWHRRAGPRCAARR
jgi:predicted ATPase